MPGQRELAPQRGGRGRKSGHARSDRIFNSQRFEPPDLLAERAPDRKIAGVQPRDILAGFGGANDLGDDLVQRERRGVDDARSRWAVIEQRLRHQRAGVEADGTARDQVASAQRDQIRSTGTRADEMHGHAGRSVSSLANAQVAVALATRGRIRRAPRTPAASAAVSATDGTPFSDCTRSLRVETRSDIRAGARAAGPGGGRPGRRATSTSPGSRAFSSADAMTLIAAAGSDV